MNSSTKAILLLIVCTFFWGSSFPIGKHALTEINALTLIFWRFTIAALSLGLYIKITRTPKNRLSHRQWLWVITISVIGISGLNFGLFTGLKYTSATNGSLIMALSPLVTALIICIAKRKMPSLALCLSLLVSLSGVLLVITDGNLTALYEMKLNQGDKLIFLGMLAWALYTYFSQAINQWMSVIQYTFVGMSCNAIIIWAVCLATPDVQIVDELVHSSISTGLDVIYIGLLSTVASYLFWLNGVQRLGPSNAVLFFNFVPIFSVLTSYMFGQSISQLQLVGIVIVITGLILPRLIKLKPALLSAS